MLVRGCDAFYDGRGSFELAGNAFSFQRSRNMCSSARYQLISWYKLGAFRLDDKV